MSGVLFCRAGHLRIKMAITKQKIDKLESALRQKGRGKPKLIFCTAYTNGDYEYERKIYHSAEELKAESSLAGYDINIFHWALHEPP